MGINAESQSDIGGREREIGKHSSKWDVSSKSHSSELRETHGKKNRNSGITIADVGPQENNIF